VSEEEAVSTELIQMITEVVAAAGRGAESLRRSGTDVELRDCSIEVMLDEAPSPSAHVRVSFGRTRNEAQDP
jgi:hypothetical protein